MISALINFSTVMINQYASLFFYGKLIHKKPNFNRVHLILMFIFSITQIVLNINNFKALGTVVTVVYFYYMFINIYNSSRIESQNYSIIIWVFSLIWDLFLMFIINILNLIPYYEENPTIAKSIGSISMALAQVLIATSRFCIKKLNNLYLKMRKLKISRKQIIYIVFTYLLIGLISFINMENKIVLISFSIGILLLILILKIIKMKYRIMTLEITNQLIEKNNEINNRIISEYRILKHNLENQLLGIKTVSNMKTKNLIDIVIKEYNESFYLKNDTISIPSGINGLVLEKLYDYKDEHIELLIQNKITGNILNKLGPRGYNLLCNALGISLDNALESTIKCKEKLLFIEFKETKDNITLKIINTFNNKIDIERFGSMNYTSKKKGHGLGLYSLLDKKRIELLVNIVNNKYINTIKIKKK